MPRKPKFQFQYGAIKTERIAMGKDAQDIFQFQYGAIKTQRLVLLPMEILISIPIWCYKNFLILKFSIIIFHFNSNMVL